MSSSSDILSRWKDDLQSLESATAAAAGTSSLKVKDLSVATSARLESFELGTGDSIIENICEHLVQAQHEILFVTCFWSSSSSLDRIRQALYRLSDRATSSTPPRRVRVKICISSLSLFQKLFHTQSPNGHIYPPSTFKKSLSLPSPDRIPGVDLQVKSIFIKPFSVMHPKFILIDRTKCILPSCNVSWEDWFEGCLNITGPIVNDFLSFWKQHWRTTGFNIPDSLPTVQLISPPDPISPNTLVRRSSLSDPASTILLPHPHHRNPRFRPLWLSPPPHPITPLNSTTLHLINTARSNIYMQTPNLTSPPVLRALLHALTRGVAVHILTNESLMTLEQLVTAGTTTPRCIQRLLKSYNKLRRSQNRSRDDNHDDTAGESIIGTPRLGDLRVEYFTPEAGVIIKNPSRAQTLARTRHLEPIHSHLKLTVFDDETVILGSGNMDRASWYTSQELGLCVVGQEFARSLSDAVREVVETRNRLVFDSEWQVE